jgi:hypothetical protein
MELQFEYPPTLYRWLSSGGILSGETGWEPIEQLRFKHEDILLMKKTLKFPSHRVS